MPPARAHNGPSAGIRYALLALGLAAWHLTPLPTLITSVIVATIPVEHDIDIGRAYIAEAQLERKLVRSSVLESAVQTISARVLSGLPAHERERYAWRFRVLDDPAVNAFALPGGFVFLNVGLLRAAKSAEEVAGVVAHEMGHVLSRHAQKRMIEERLLGTLFQSLTHDDGDDEDEGFGERVAETLARGAMQMGGLRFSRANEFEADAKGSELLRAAGIGVSGMVTFFEGLLRAEGGSTPNSLPNSLAAVDSIREWLSTHPATSERIASIKQQVEALPAHARRRAWGDANALAHAVDWARVRRELALTVRP
jgi:predicted Zn-dependent protease